MNQTLPLFQLDETKESEVFQQPITTDQERACLVKIYPACVDGSLMPLDKDRLVFGRDATCDFELTDSFVSREHAEIVLVDNAWVLRDLNSTNGSYVNDFAIAEQTLHPGDQIRIGHHIYKFLSSDHVEAMYHEAVFQMMTTDALTQCYNRRYFEDTFEREVIRTMRHGRTLGVLLFDIDHFKAINDEYGHLVGDELLSGMCRRMRSRIREDEVFARIGGEEFALVVVEISRSKVEELANELSQLVSSRPFPTSKGEVNMTMSIGVMHTNGLEPLTPRELLDRADRQLYESKNAGRNCVRIH